MMTFVLPTEAHRDDMLSFYGEFKDAGIGCIGCACADDYDRWLGKMQNRHDGKNLPEGYVRENFYLCYSGAELVGVFSLKFELTDYLRRCGGHIGYAVRPSEMNKGYATQMLAEGLKIAKSLGFERVLCVCDEDNITSEKVIVKNGGVFENMLFDADENVYVKRYWIDT